MKILGISAFYHDSAACLINDGAIVSAAQEERFSRKKHDPRFPKNAINFCLNSNQVKLHEIDHVVFYDKPYLKFDRLLETYFAFAPGGFVNFSTSLPFWIKDKLFQKKKIMKSLDELSERKVDWDNKLLFSEHHMSHAASAFYPSPFNRSAILTMDGVGEWATTTFATGSDNQIRIEKEIHFPHSIGLLYSAFTSYIGFKVNSGEYKVMGLAPYGKPNYSKLIRENIIDIKEDGSFQLNMAYFDYCTGKTMTTDKFHELFGARPRSPESDLSQREMDIAASIQEILDEVVIKLARGISKYSGEKNLCLAGGVALNCVSNGKLLKEDIFEKIWIQPAAGDAGGSIGAALAAYHQMYGQPRINNSSQRDAMNGAYLGPSFTSQTIEENLRRLGAIFTAHSEEDTLEITANALSNGNAIGWFQGRMEFGPRSLGARSILADARNENMQKTLNLKVKFRESFRPFAPSILYEDLKDWFELEEDSPYMLLVSEILDKKRTKMTVMGDEFFGIDKLNLVRSGIPAVTHVDYSARIQTVHRDTNPKFHALISRFKELTGCPVLVNTSFNVRGEPIVCSPEDAFNCFMGTDLDYLVIDNFILKKHEQTTSMRKDYHTKYDLD